MEMEADKTMNTDSKEVLDPNTIKSRLKDYRFSLRVFPLINPTSVKRHLGSWFSDVMEIINTGANGLSMSFEIWTEGDDSDSMRYVCNFTYGNPTRYIIFVESHLEKLRWKIGNDENRVIPCFSSPLELKMKLGLTGEFGV